MSSPKSVPAAGGKKFAAPALYKDYNKATNDFLTKNYPAAGTWKVESKFKGPKDTFFVNPSATSDGKFAADIEYAPSSCGAALKLNVTPQGLDNLKSTMTYNVQGHKIEAVVHKKAGNEFDYEISHETTVMAGKKMSMNEKLNKKAITLGLGIDVAPNCQIGCGADYVLKDKKCNWSAGCRYASNGIEAAIRTMRLETYVTSASFPIKTKVNGNDIKINIAAETICGRGRGVDATVGVESACPVYPTNVVKARVNKNCQWAVAYIAKLADNWTVAVSVDQNKKAGVLLSHS